MMTRCVGSSLSLAFLGAAHCLAAAEATALPPLPPHPRLLFNAAGLAELKARVATAPWAASRWAALREAAAKRLAEPVELPPRGGNWSHNYVCPTHSARLKPGPRLGPWEWEHTCPVGPHTLKGDPNKANLDFDGNGIAGVHGDLAAQIVDHALVYHLTGEAAHAERARAILMAYAERYRQYPLHDNRGRPGRGARVHSQSLTEASWLITMAQGADLIWATLADADRDAAAEGLFRPALTEIILPAKGGIHNIQCRHNSAIGLVGFLLGDAELIRTAIDDPERGYRQQMQRGVQSDGVWIEGAWGYHFFTIDGLWPLTEAARNCGIDLYGPELKRLFDAPFLLAMPNLVLPAFNDSGEVALNGQADLYELAYARYHEPRYVPLLSAGNRGGRRALYVGAPVLADAAEPLPRVSANAEASGYAILQRGTDQDATWLCLKYGPHGGGHGHPDKLNVVLYARGKVILPDVGTKAYASPLHAGWDKTTLAHNTLVIDQTSQAPTQGRCLAFGRAGDADYAIAAAGAPYPDVRFTRTVALLTPELLLFVDQVQCAAPRLLDLAWHLRGNWAATPVGDAWQPPEKPGYRYLADGRRQFATGTTPLAVRIADGWTAALALAGGNGDEILTGTGVGKDSTDRIPLVLQRRTAANTAFVTALHLDGTAVALESLAARDAAGQTLPAATAIGVRLQVADRTWLLAINPERQPVTFQLPEGQAWTVAEPFAVR